MGKDEATRVTAYNRSIFLLSTLVTGAVAGACIWAILFVMNAGISLIWGRMPIYLGSFYPIIVCTIGGIIIGLFAKRFGDYPETLPTVMAKVREEGRYGYDKLGVMSAGAVLPLVFGGSVGPEAGLTGVIAALCTWVSDCFKRFGKGLRGLTDVGVYATLSTIFTAPLYGFVGVATDDHDGMEDRIPKMMRVLTYVFAVAGALSALISLSHLFGGGMSMPRYTDVTYGVDEFLWLVPVCMVGAFGGWLFVILDRMFHRVSDALDDMKVVKATLGGLLLGSCGLLLPLTMFSGELQTEELDGMWMTLAPSLLLAIGFVKIAITALCVNMGWRGGHFFPVIFAGISIGYGLSTLFSIDPIFSVCASTAAVVGGVMRRPLMTVLLLFLCFPLHSVLILAVAATIGSCIPLPGIMTSDDGKDGGRIPRTT